MSDPIRSVLALALFTTACAAEPDHDHDDTRLAVVLADADGEELTLGSYEPETGALALEPEARDVLRAMVGARGHMSVGPDEEPVDLASGTALVDVDLAEGDVLALRIYSAAHGARVGWLDLRVQAPVQWRTASQLLMEDLISSTSYVDNWRVQR